MKNRYSTLLLLILAILAIFAIRAFLAERIAMPRTFEVFDTLTVVGALVVVLKDRRYLRRGDWLVALILGAVIGIGMLFATLFSPYPFLGLVKSAPGQALLRGLFTALAILGGLAIMRQGGPVQFSIANGDWRSAGRGALLGLTVGLPLAILNVFALWLTQGQSFDWQHPLAALLDALQPAVVEEVIHRFALWGLLWLLLRRSSHPGTAPRSRIGDGISLAPGCPSFSGGVLICRCRLAPGLLRAAIISHPAETRFRRSRFALLSMQR